MESGKAIPKVSRWLILKNISAFMKNPIPILLGNMSNVGDTYSTSLDSKARTIMTRDIGLIRHVLQKNHTNYEKSAMQTDVLARYIGKGLLTTNGSYWLRQRRMIQPGFHKKKLESLVSIMNTAILEYCDTLEEKIKVNEVVDIHTEMNQATLYVIARSLFSQSIDLTNISNLGYAITRLQHAIVKDVRLPMLNWWRGLIGYNKESEKLAKETQAMLMAIIQERKNAEEKPDDLLDMLLDVRYADDGSGMTDQQVLEESLVLFVAGHETSANAMAWMHYLLAQNPKELSKIENEINQLRKNDLNMEDAMRLSAISQGVSETMRIYPPAWITDRVALSDDVYEGMQIKKGDIVAPFIYAVHHDTAHWDDPEEFVPSRFDKNQPKRDNYAFFPFGGGPRLCIGQQFAILEMQLIIYHLYKRFDFELIPDQEIEMEPLVTLRPRNGIKMKVRKK